MRKYIILEKYIKEFFKINFGITKKIYKLFKESDVNNICQKLLNYLKSNKSLLWWSIS